MASASVVAPHNAGFAECEGCLGECFGDTVGVLGRVGAKLAQQKTPAFRQQQHIVDRQVLAEHVVDHQPVEAFQADRLVLEDRGHVIGGDKGIGKTQRYQPAMLRAVLEHAVAPAAR